MHMQYACDVLGRCQLEHSGVLGKLLVLRLLFPVLDPCCDLTEWQALSWYRRQHTGDIAYFGVYRFALMIFAM